MSAFKRLLKLLPVAGVVSIALSLITTTPEQLGTNAAVWAQWLGLPSPPAWFWEPDIHHKIAIWAFVLIVIYVAAVWAAPALWAASHRTPETAETPKPAPLRMPSQLIQTGADTGDDPAEYSVISGKGDPDPDCWVLDAIYYGATGNWPTKPEDRDVDQFGQLGGPLFDNARTLRNHAYRGRLRIWGRIWPNDLPIALPKEYWEFAQINWGTVIKGDPLNVQTELARPARIQFYMGLETLKADVEKLWPRTKFVTAALVELGKLRTQGVDFRESRRQSLSTNDIAWLEQWQTAVVQNVRIISPPEVTFFETINTADLAKMPASALKNSHLIWLTARFDHMERVIHEYTPKPRND